MIQGSNLMLESFKVHARQVTFQAFFTEELHSRSEYSSYEAIDFLRNLLVCYKSIIMNHFYWYPNLTKSKVSFISLY